MACFGTPTLYNRFVHDYCIRLFFCLVCMNEVCFRFLGFVFVLFCLEHSIKVKKEKITIPTTKRRKTKARKRISSSTHSHTHTHSHSHRQTHTPTHTTSCHSSATAIRMATADPPCSESWTPVTRRVAKRQCFGRWSLAWTLLAVPSRRRTVVPSTTTPRHLH